MLTKIEVENFKGFNEPLIFDLTDTKNYEFNPECIKDGVVNKGMIYGINGCGKSNLGLALFDLVSHLTDKTSHFALYENYLNGDSVKEYATFAFHFKFNGLPVIYRYAKKSLKELIWETLEIDGVKVIHSESNQIQTSLVGLETLNKNFPFGMSGIKYIKSNASWEANNTNQAVQNFLNFVDRMLFFRTLMQGELQFLGYAANVPDIFSYLINKGYLTGFKNFLNRAGINCRLTPGNINGITSINFVYSNDKMVDFWAAASTGTKNLAFFYFWLRFTEENGAPSFIFIDEFNAFFHHDLSFAIAEELKKLPSQIILTTHNTSVMTNDLFRPDCYFLMKDNVIKSISNITETTTKKELRFAHNLEKMYRAGSFNE